MQIATIGLVFTLGFPYGSLTNTCSDDGLVACPSCGRRMKEENVFSHLDTCSGENTTSDSLVVKAAAMRSVNPDAGTRRSPS